MLDYDQWERATAPRRAEDQLWCVKAYRLACFAVELAYADAEALARGRPTRLTAAQLFESVASIGANIAEGFSRSSGRDRARFFEYALGSAREARHWYRCGSRVLNADRVERAVGTLNQLVHLLLVMAKRARANPTRFAT